MIIIMIMMLWIIEYVLPYIWCFVFSLLVFLSLFSPFSKKCVHCFFDEGSTKLMLMVFRV